jgi:hypothetical protein
MSEHQTAFPSDEDIDDMLAEFAGDHRQAIRALLTDLAALANDYGSTVSRGFVRCSIPSLTIPRRVA